MPGIKGRSGGARTGAGRKLQKVSLTQDQHWFGTITYPDGGAELGEIITVKLIGRNRVDLEFADGRKLCMVK